MERIQQRKITRNRELRACTECRKRKLKCDRQLPCASCTRRNEATSCVYERNFEGLQSEHGRRLQAEAKLEHLEQLVQELSQSRQTFANHDGMTPSANTVQRDRDELPNDSLYNGATHWSAMLEDIEELRTAIREHDDIDGADIDLSSDEGDETGLVFGATKPLSFQQVLSQFLPLRHEADRLVAAYFRAKAVAAPFIHTAHFSRLYRLFWDNPSTASPLWTSILFSILDIATRTLSTSSGASTGENSKANRFATAAAHCLAVGEYYRPQRFAVEALLLYAQSKCLTSVDISPVVAILFGTLARLATIMGYHRDADGSREGISAFEGEMRRRTWSLCMQLDMLVSFQLGLPSNIQFPTWDTRPPTNLLDSDFDEDTVQLPPARPDLEPTELLFYIAKHRLMAVFEKIIRHTLSATDRPSDELEVIEQELRGTYAALPVVFQPRPMADSIVDSPSVVVTRLCVYFIYQKCLCVLHRKYVTRGRQNSVQICYDSALNLVRRFLDIYKEFEPGGQLETERWFMSSITWHDFLLGCTALCLTVCSTRHYAIEPASTAIVDVVGSLELLQNAKAVCEKQSARSRDTRKVRQLVEATILKFSGQDNGGIPTTQISLHSGQDVASSAHWQAIPSPQGDKDWLWNESTIRPVEDTAWAYMEQFLDLPNEDFMTDT
jgi:Fungal Zn(2)-Cys(6) binuclear cluster domain/Fungal specific transcription factor domain